MTPTSLAIVGATVVLSSFVSGVFGMGGGMVLLGMLLFSVVQLAANGWRALHWRRYVLWPIFYGYVGGALLAFAVMRTIAYVPNKAVVYVLLGLMPFSVD